MPLHEESIRYGEGAAFSGFLAYLSRAALPIPAVVVIQEAWGVDEHVEDVTRRFALAGYAALAPDVYARGGTRPEALSRARMAELKAFINELKPGEMMDPAKREAAIATKPEPLQGRLRESFQAMAGMIGDGEANLLPLLAATKHLREELVATRGQRIASVGFCMGGGLSALLATADPSLAGAVIFYGMAPRDELVPKIACPILGLYGSLDQRVNPGLPAFAQSMKAHGKSFEHHVYEGAQHAFFNDTRPSYDVRAARDAFARTLSFFRERLA
jgi:carboxymethylenebutenolidase